jgi:CHASE2 domain-containing sensor protein
MTGGILVGAAASYFLVEWGRDGGLAKGLPVADVTPWLWVGALSVIALLLASAWYRFGRGVCAAASIGFVITAAMAVRGGHNHLAPPLISAAFACVCAVGIATFVEERVRRPT